MNAVMEYAETLHVAETRPGWTGAEQSVANYLAAKLNLEADAIRQAEVNAFVLRVGIKVLVRRVPGIGIASAKRLLAVAERAAKPQEIRATLDKPARV